MEGYTITQVADLIELKVHTIRYWEKNIPILTEVQRDEFGKRIYNKKDIFILMRLKHFTEDRQFTLKGAAEELQKELSNSKDRLELDSNTLEIKNIIQKLEHQKNVLQAAQELLNSDLRNTPDKQLEKQIDTAETNSELVINKEKEHLS